MKLATFMRNGKSSVGTIVGEGRLIIDLHEAARAKGKDQDVFADMITFLESNGRGKEVAQQLINQGGMDNWIFRLEQVRLLAPVPSPRKLFAVAGNYAEHIEEGGGVLVSQDKETPRIFMKPPSSAVIGQGDSIRIPPVAQAIDWEGELAVIMGKRAKAVKRDKALDYVAGYTIMNDVSERKLRIWNRSDSRPQDQWFDWLNGKWYDTFAPLGPWMVTCEDIPNPQTLDISTYVNGERKQNCNTAQMIFPVALIIEYLSAMVTLEPGDVISTGTVAGVGAVSGQFLQPGDLVRIKISGIGELSNPVVQSEV